MSELLIRNQKDSLVEVSEAGKFLRTASIFRQSISKEGGDFKPEFGRYHLYISYACPWATRCLTVLKLKKLDACIGVTVVHPTWQRTRPEDENDLHCGWAFADEETSLPFSSPSGCGSFPALGCRSDVVNNTKFVRDLYELCTDGATKYTVPILWDKHTRTIVNNESSEIMRMLSTEFNEWASGPFAGVDFYLESLRGVIDDVNSWVYTQINDGVYKCGFARSQAAYDEAVTELYAGLDRVEQILSSNRYLAGMHFTEADIRLFQTLVRFDEVYVVYFKCNVRKIVDYPNIRNYVREIYQMPGVCDCVNMYHIKTHYFSSHAILNPFSVIPKGPDAEQDFKLPHDRQRLQCKV